jgi:hypothetical protein
MYRNCQKCGALMHGPSYPAWQNNCVRCEEDRIKDAQHAEGLAKAKKQPVNSGPIVDGNSVAEIENEELRAEISDLRNQIRQERLAHQDRADHFDADRDALARQNAALRAALGKWEEIMDQPFDATVKSSVVLFAEASAETRLTLALTPPAAVREEDTCEK